MLKITAIDREHSFFQVLQRKTEEAAMATKRLKELLEARKSSTHDNSGICFSYINSYIEINCSIPSF